MLDLRITRHHHVTQDQVRGDEKSKVGKIAYKLTFAFLPTARHVFEPGNTWRFVICAWRTNDAKNDMSHTEFVALCQRVVAHHQPPPTTVTPAKAGVQLPSADAGA